MYAGESASAAGQQEGVIDKMAGIGTFQPYSVSYRDYSGESKSVRLYVGEITSLTLDTITAGLTELTDALDAVTLGVRAKQVWGVETVVSNARAAVKDAQIETELLVRMRGATSERPYSIRIPTVDYTKFNFADPPAGDQVIITGAGASAETIDLIDAIEANCKMPDNDAEGVTVVGMEVVR